MCFFHMVQHSDERREKNMKMSPAAIWNDGSSIKCDANSSLPKSFAKFGEKFRLEIENG